MGREVRGKGESWEKCLYEGGRDACGGRGVAATMLPSVRRVFLGRVTCCDVGGRAVRAARARVVVFEEERILDLPNVGLGPDRELEVLLGDRVPELVHHHDGEEHAERVEERPVEVVRHGVADRVAKRKQQDLADDPERGPKDDVADGPAVVQRAEDEQQLRDDVDHDAREVEDELEDPEAGRFRAREAGGVLEGADRDQAGDQADDGRGALQDLPRGSGVASVRATGRFREERDL